MIRHMGQALTHMPMEHTIMVIGSMINSMETEWKVGPMVQNTKASIGMARKTAKVN
jgi:hypothetical protein